MRRIHDIAYRWRGPLMAPLYLVLVSVFVGETECDSYVWPVGLILFFVGVALRVWAQTHLHYRLSVRKTLTTTGPYTFVRNPIYIANTLMLVGLTVLSELLWWIPVTLVWCAIIYSLVVRREERHLLEKYGDPYRVYVKTVPRWIPLRPRNREDVGLARRFVWSSLRAEAHCLLLLLPLIGKEVLSHVAG